MVSYLILNVPGLLCFIASKCIKIEPQAEYCIVFYVTCCILLFYIESVGKS